MHASISDFVSEVVQNAIDAGAARITLQITTAKHHVRVCCEDDGKGMRPEEVRASWDPRRSGSGKHPRRRMGMGLPLLRQTVESAGGRCVITSAPGQGTRVAFFFDRDHIDCPPVGDLPGACLALLAFPGAHDLAVERIGGDGRRARVSRRELTDTLGDLEQAVNLIVAGKFLQNLEDQVSHGDTNR